MSVNLKQIFLLSSLLFASWGCHEKLDLDVCRPGDPACGDEDYDGDGVVNKKSFEIIFPPQIAFIYKIFQILPNKVYNYLINKFVNR